MGKHTGLAAAGTGQHQQGAGGGAYGFALRLIEGVDEDRRDIHGVMITNSL